MPAVESPAVTELAQAISDRDAEWRKAADAVQSEINAELLKLQDDEASVTWLDVITTKHRGVPKLLAVMGFDERA